MPEAMPEATRQETEPESWAQCTESRRESLRIALGLGADPRTLENIRESRRVSRHDYIILPAGRFEGMSRGKGWARLGRGAAATWGERGDDGGYVCRVPGRWTVGSNDGFQRKEETVWKVAHIKVGDQTWTIAD